MSYAYYNYPNSYYGSGFYFYHPSNGFYISQAAFASLPEDIQNLRGYGYSPTPAFYNAAYSFLAGNGVTGGYSYGGTYGYQAYQAYQGYYTRGL